MRAFLGVEIIAADLGSHQVICSPPESTVCPQSGHLPGRQAVLRDRAEAFDRLVDVLGRRLSLLKQSEQRDHWIDYNFRLYQLAESLDVTCREPC